MAMAAICGPGIPKSEIALGWLCMYVSQTDYSFFLFTPVVKIYLEH